jgi:hypothetical protein
MSGPSVRWRSEGHHLQPDSDVLRFGSAEPPRHLARAGVDSIITYRSNPEVCSRISTANGNTGQSHTIVGVMLTVLRRG